ncbi:hypothetical protein BFW01_g5427 [Lasiodiplodia theobromae]|uniref:Mtf2-like C-terminal domain-containing protein n=1 Tax=Lasiodiplodia theobromae TaxID=45133 RepID=A0A5N5DQ03_9PEZI|nr:uncharacterized protein LTHEOB_926 [Lasiodiplodia theobromae]KAB2579883.1 hypothetical protein DBV05_g1539 [Lasiodiplodia theobromae]KAF4540984.1 hypothetical protein LTHEOB_926 [Lasiodiplodia theobromae]KAF9634532.1 hypothetical protein BFW01_g5427 [Lasiodiplodia theobromae]
MTPSSVAQRTLLPLNTTLLPFLYQTRTILGRGPRRSFARTDTQIRCLNAASEIASRRNPSHGDERADTGYASDVPFESEQEESFHQQRNATITERERRTFENLFKKYNATKPVYGEGKGDVNDDLTDDTLESILDQAIAGMEPGDTGPVSSSGMTPLARRELMKKRAIHHEEEDTLLRKAQRREQFERIEQLMKAAKSDVELWNVLETEVLSVIRRLDLDAPRPPRGQSEETERDEQTESQGKADPSSELEIIGPNYPSLMLVAMRQLRVDFPGSTLGLALLPAIKNLGRGSYALGASTELYNELLAMTWLTYSDFQGLDDLLQEMENGGIDFDANTLDLLDSIKRNALDARSRRLGDGASAILEMDRFKRGIKRLQRWRDAIRLRMEAEAIRQAKERELQL